MYVDALVGRLAGISYLHIPAHDPAVSAEFYRAVFGWQTHGDPDGPGFADGTGHVIGRWVTDQAVVGTDGLRAYIYVANVDDTLTAVNVHGGRMVRARYAEGTLQVALFADPAGNVLGLWTETANAPESP